MLILTGAGVGGGSLGYANTLYQPPDGVYADPQWAHITDWRDELAPYYDQARRMLGVATYPGTSPADRVMREVADDMGIGATYRNADVGVFFGAPGTRPGTDVPDPYFGGVGPDAAQLRALRRVHDRLPAQRQEHAGQELPLPRRAGRGAGAPADVGRTRCARAPAAATRSHAPHRATADAAGARARARFTADQVDLLGRRARHGQAAARPA